MPISPAVPTHICDYCQQENIASAVFCTHCGHALHDKDSLSRLAALDRLPLISAPIDAAHCSLCGSPQGSKDRADPQEQQRRERIEAYNELAILRNERYFPIPGAG